MPKHLLVCDCQGSQTIDVSAIENATGLQCSRVFTGLCTTQMASAVEAMAQDDLTIACQQERTLFEQLAEEQDLQLPGFVDIRDRGGWSEQGAQAGPKMAALVAESQISQTSAKSVDVYSEGLCLIVGGEAALEAAGQLCDTLSVTVLLDGDVDLPTDRRFDVVRGKIRSVSGALGGFSVRIDALQQLEPGGRGAFTLSDPRNGASSDCDILLDLGGGTPLVPAPQKREGYVRADPADPVGVARSLTTASQLVGTFEKPLYVRLEPSLCAHSRANQSACSRCLDACPTGAITSAGEHVAIDPMVCAGCGACSALCPSGAISYEDPPVSSVFQRMETLARVYRSAGGTAPRLLVTDAEWGTEMISLAARFGRGLPADVVPMALPIVSGFGHAEMLAGLGCGFAGVDVLVSPTADRSALSTELTLAEAIAGSGKLRLLDVTDPDALSDLLFDAPVAEPVDAPILPMGSRRQVSRLAAKALHPEADAPLDLPDGAPYGAVLVDTDSCTLCLSCVSLCPSGALIDNPDMPQLRFQEDACLQCGLCHNICPENAIALKPQLNLSDDALGQVVLHEEEPFACVECGALFGVKSTVEKITEKLAGNHSMFANPAAARMIQMCDNCRVNAQFHSQNNPFQGGEVRRPKTTSDYLSERKDH